MTHIAEEDKPFTFDFAISEQAKDWQELDAQTPLHTEKKHQSLGKSFFSNTNAGSEYFKVDDPATVKRKWLEDRRLVKDAVRRTGKHFLWDKFLHHPPPVPYGSKRSNAQALTNCADPALTPLSQASSRYLF
ncbi:expressed conserved protein [Echinococcus multilocularis]|uniref:Expressed conserved protein n=1 Tax=Echinococcus multilocularis TaxID=6211 RepID=A0A087VXN8_ECHMU|nr:expressed conserved protein [Echinococcus multilocularis]